MYPFDRSHVLPALIGMALSIAACGGPSYSGSNDKEQNKASDLAGIPWGSATLTPITGGLSGIEIAGRCTLDKINGKLRTEAGSVTSAKPLVLRGWAANAFNAPPKNAMFALQSPEEAFAIKLDVNMDRADVAKALGAQALSKSGFELTIPPPLPAGTYRTGILHGGPEDPQACSFDYDLVID